MRKPDEIAGRTTEKILAVIMGGGRGSRLYPLTQQRSKPAVPIAGKYRLIDIPISNCINSGIFRIAVLTQFNSVSLHRHVTQTYHFDAFHIGWVQIWAAEQTIANADWYQGTADAVRKQLFEIKSTNAPYVLILAGDHLYRMDYAAMARFHIEKKADITVAVQPVAAHDTHRFGILKRNGNQNVNDFAEKPTAPDELSRLVSRDDQERPYLGSMGIYLFNTDVLIDLLENNHFDDFGRHVIPSAIYTHSVYCYDFDGYWEDIGTIRSFYETNLALTGENPPFNFSDAERPIYSNPRLLPGTIIENSCLECVLLTDGCRIKKSEIRRSVIGVRSHIGCNNVIMDSVIMGADYFETDLYTECSNTIPIGVGNNCHIESAIIDKNARVGEGVVIKQFPRDIEIDNENWYVRDGIVVIPKRAVLQPGTIIAP